MILLPTQTDMLPAQPGGSSPQTPAAQPQDPTVPALDSAAPVQTSAAQSQDISAADSSGHAAAPDRQQTDSLGRPLSDSLALRLFGADSLSGSDSLFLAGAAGADSLALAPEPDPLYRPASVREVFGSQTLVAAPVPTFHSEPLRPLTGNPFFEGFVLLLAAAYALLLYRHIGDIKLLLYRVSHDRASSERLMEDPGGNTLARFLKISAAIGLLFIGVAAARYAETFIAPALFPALPPQATAAVCLFFAALWAVIAAYQSLVLRTATAITLTRPFMNQLWLLKRTYFALAVVVATPPLLLFALCPPGAGRLWLGLSLLELAVTAVLYVRETLHLFLSKKVPILHWFLYLCAVEIFPFSLLALTAVR
ncbi:MAG: DUF4271 domain-containing protein [Alistipes sp.]|nr:DUF4271 domain-containing protein [Alistipes sp.]